MPILPNGIDGCQYPSVNPIAALAASCPPVLRGELTTEQARELASLLKVLADETRLRLLSLLQAQLDGEACVCHLTGPLGLTQPTVSHHLRVLLDAGLVTRDQRGSWAYYRARPDALAALARLLR